MATLLTSNSASKTKSSLNAPSFFRVNDRHCLVAFTEVQLKQKSVVDKLLIMNVPQVPPPEKSNGRSPIRLTVHSVTKEIWNKLCFYRLQIFFQSENIHGTCVLKLPDIQLPKTIASPLTTVEQEPKAETFSSTTVLSAINLPLESNMSWVRLTAVLTKSKWFCLVLNSQKSPVKPSAQEHSKILEVSI